ncbi:MAG: RNA polymerase factor sigma-54 [Fimbriimonadales bacterium]
MSLSQRLEASVGLRVDPRVVLSSQILQLTQAELEQTIEAELNENPALERLQDDNEPLSDETILKNIAPQELRIGSDDYEFWRSLPSDHESVDWVELAPSGTTLWEHLRAQLLSMLPRELHRIAEYAIECVNEKGYLTTPAEEIALETGTSIEVAELVVKKLQQCEPAGVGAFNLQQCLLLQLRSADTIEEKLARVIIQKYMDEFIGRRTSKLMRRFRVLPEVVEAAFQEILSLTPFPGECFDNTAGYLRRSRSVGVSPDLVLTRTEAEWLVEVRGADPSSFMIEHEYRKRFKELQDDERAPKDEKRHITTYVNRANDFIACIRQRKKTLRMIGEYLVQHQGSFVSTGSYEFLLSLTRSQMAHDLGVHESTISRATQAKFVQIANGEIVSFDVFFKPALRVQKMIEEILQHENPNHPMSDETISHMLAKRGVHVARRTVNKYRDRTKLLSSRKRRSA